MQFYKKVLKPKLQGVWVILYMTVCWHWLKCFQREDFIQTSFILTMTEILPERGDLAFLSSLGDWSKSLLWYYWPKYFQMEDFIQISFILALGEVFPERGFLSSLGLFDTNLFYVGIDYSVSTGRISYKPLLSWHWQKYFQREGI